VRVAFLLLLALYATLAATAMLADSSVADEHPHILSGWLYWESGRFSGGLDNPPLGQLLVAAPFRMPGLEYRFPDDARIAFARLPVVLLLLALAVLVALWSSRLCGAALAVVALAMLNLEPNLIAHGHLATLDLPLTFFWWATLWQWRAVLCSARAPSSRTSPVDAASRAEGSAWTALAGFFVALALAVFTKFTGLLLIPVCALVAVFALDGGRARLRACGVVAITLVGLALVSHLVYGFGDTRYGLPSRLVDAASGKLAHRGEGHFSYLMGRRSVEGFPEYYLVTLLVKTPLPLLALALTGLLTGWRQLSRLDRALLVVPAVAIVASFSAVGVNIGVRHVLPVYPALVIAAVLGARFAWRRRFTRAVLVLVWGAWLVGIARVVPQQLAYFNVVAGGAAGGDRWLIDSNLDWGQDERRLRRFLETAGARGETWEINPDGARARSGRFVVNANTLHNLMRRDATRYAWLRGLRPSGYAGYAWQRYDLQGRDFAARVTQQPSDVAAHIAYAEVLAQDGDWSRAEATYSEAARWFAREPRLFRSAAESALQRDDFDAAVRWLRRGVEANPDDAELRAWGRRLQLERVVRESQVPKEVARAQASLGSWWAERGDVERAAPWLSSAAEALPNDVGLLRALGITESYRGRFAAAVDVLERAPVAAALRAEAEACRRLARTEAALHGAASLPHGDAPAARPGRDAWMELATTHFRNGRNDRAAAALVEILRADPADGDAVALLSEMQVRATLHVVEGTLTPRALRHDDNEPTGGR
jgi:tetratricopeptide (TPR) repeat protein